ncbi:MAG: hypothetical protein ICV66_05940 [Chitinophagaceae bacterium]|nr:hypothetical protein [Chitinophagaceae bacterium]
MNWTIHMKRAVYFLLSILFITSIHAQDRYFGYTYTSNVLPKGAIDLEFWHTSRIGRENQFFHAQDQRMEVEFGLGKNWQTAFYFNRYHTRFSSTINGTQTSSEIGFSNEWKVKLSDPNQDFVGLALYGEWGIKGGDELEFEGKAIIDKSFGKNLFAMNIVGEHEKEFEWKDGESEAENKTKIEVDLGYMYHINTDFGLGFEIKNNNEVEKGKWEHSALFTGPVLNYRTERWFVIATVLPQVRNLRRTNEAPGKLVLDEHERLETRILIGISL